MFLFDLIYQKLYKKAEVFFLLLTKVKMNQYNVYNMIIFEHTIEI